MPADVLAPGGARTSADKLMTTFSDQSQILTMINFCSTFDQNTFMKGVKHLLNNTAFQELTEPYRA